MNRSQTGLAFAALVLISSAPAGAQDEEPSRPDDHAPISVMADHYHEAGEFMVSYRYMHMSMEGNSLATSRISPETIVTTIPNRFFGIPMQPPTLRVVPTEMSMDMHMLGLMYAPSDRVTLMGMLNYVNKEMEHTTFAGGMGTTVLGRFKTKASGLGDTSLSALVRLFEREDARLHVTVGASIPTGETNETGAVLAPTGAQPVLRLPYPMQLGSGTYDLLTGLTYTSFINDGASWGMQWRSVLRTGDNDEGYTFGDEHRVTGWFSRLISQNLSWSARVEWFDRGNIDGIDPMIIAPVQTADPSRQGATRIDAALGLNFVSNSGHRIAFEWSTPLRQDLDGPQLEIYQQFTIGYQFSF